MDRVHVVGEALVAHIEEQLVRRQLALRAIAGIVTGDDPVSTQTEEVLDVVNLALVEGAGRGRSLSDEEVAVDGTLSHHELAQEDLEAVGRPPHLERVAGRAGKRRVVVVVEATCVARNDGFATGNGG